MKTIAIMNVKGGVGKTASATNIAYILAKKMKQRVLLVDTDAQGNASDFFFGKEKSTSDDESMERTMELFYNAVENKKLYDTPTLSDILDDVDNKLDIHKCILPTMCENLFLLPAEIGLTEAEKRLQTAQFNSQRLKNHLDTVWDEFDCCIFDCSPYLNHTTTNVLVCTDMVYTPLRPDMASLKGLAVTYNFIENTKTYVSTLQYGGAFFTAAEKGKYEKVVLQTAKLVLEQNLPDVLIPIDIRKSKAIEEATYLQKPIIETGAEGKKVADDYIALTKYIMKQLDMKGEK